MHIDNIMVIQPNKDSDYCEIVIIDYGLSCIMDDVFPQKPSLTGFKFMVPP